MAKTVDLNEPLFPTNIFTFGSKWHLKVNLSYSLSISNRSILILQTYVKICYYLTFIDKIN